MKRRNVMKTTMAMLMVYVMAFLTACGGGDVMPLPTSMAEEAVAEPVEITETTDNRTVVDETEPDEETDAEETFTTETDIDTESVTDTVETDACADAEPESETDKNEKTDAEKQSETQKTAESVVAEFVQEEVKPVHTHNYTGNVTASPSCVNAGIMTYVCECGNSYVEPIVAAGHQWATTTETVHHPSLGHMERTERQVTKLRCRCGYITDNNADFQAHRIAGQNAWEGDILRCPCAGSELYWTETVYEDNWVVTQEEYDEAITKTVCAVCGAVQ